MLHPRKTRSRRNNRGTDPLQILQGNLHDQGFLEILDSVPASDRLKFEQAPDEDGAIEVCLGNRPKANGSLCQAWARISSDNHIEFYDQEKSLETGRIREYPRSAFSLTRKAMDLHPPLCFLHHDPHDRAEHMREKLCAVIIYYAILAGVEMHIDDWNELEDKLTHALQQINFQAAYHQWRRDQTLAATRQSQKRNRREDAEKLDRQPTSSEDPEAVAEELLISRAIPGFTGGTINLADSTLTIRPHTSLARLRDQLGDDKIRSLNKLLTTPLTISLHGYESDFFPFRMLIGTTMNSDGKLVEIHAYLVHDGGKCTGLRYLSHDNAADKTSWTVDDLLEVTLFAPFKILNNPGKDTYKRGTGKSARGAKIKSLILYYFFVAENEGLTGNPLVTINESFGKRLSTVIKELQDARGSQLHPDSAQYDGPSCEQPTDLSLQNPIGHVSVAQIELTEREESDSELARAVISMARLEAGLLGSRIGHTDEEMSDAHETQQQGQDGCEMDVPDIRVAPEMPTLRPMLSPSPQLALERIHSVSQTPEAIESIPKTPPDKFSDRNGFSTEGENTGAPACRSSLDMIFAQDMSDTPCGRSSSVITNDDYVPMDISPPESVQGHNYPTTDKCWKLRVSSEAEDALTDSHKANSLVAQVLDNRPPTPERSLEREMKGQTEPGGQRGLNNPDADVIDLCSDDNENAISLRSISRADQHTPGSENRRQSQTQVAFRPEHSANRSARYMYWVDSDDDILEETDGSAHRRACFRRLR